MATEKRLIDADAEIATIKENVCKNCNSYTVTYNGVVLPEPPKMEGW